MRISLILLCSISSLQSILGTPIKSIADGVGQAQVATSISTLDFCQLPPEFDGVGSTKFFEDCESISRFTIPIPSEQYGPHPRVCCPRVIGASPICFPTDPWCPSYEEPTYDYEDYGAEEDASSDLTDDAYIDERVTPDEEFPPIPQPTEVLMSNGEANCAPFSEAACTPISRCALRADETPQTQAPCSFDIATSQLMICCPADQIVQEPAPIPQPRFPKNGKARECEDRTNLCRRWKNNGACALDRTFITSEISPAFSPQVSSPAMFNFMSQACMKECGRCGNKGCVDEHPSCPAWARQGFCVKTPFFMVHTCRESCGLCGFLSTMNTEVQEMNGNTYSNYKDSNFDCGRQKLLSELEEQGIKVSTVKPDDTVDTPQSSSAAPLVSSTNEEFIGSEDADIRVSGNSTFNLPDPDADFDDDVSDVSFANANDEATIRCGVTLISDRWMITAAHCYDRIEGSGAGIRVNTIRTVIPDATELIETKNVYIHPNYAFGSLYSDIALLELGRRVVYDFDNFGDTPACLDQDLELDKKRVVVQGYGQTEEGTQGSLLEANTTLLNVKDCSAEIKQYLVRRPNKRDLFCKSFEFGITDEQICAKGDFIEEDGVISGACKGDSGGPVLYRGKDGKETLVGIVSGSLACSSKAPEWYTRFSYFRSWIDCVVNSSPANNYSKEKVEELCKNAARPPHSGPKLDFC